MQLKLEASPDDIKNQFKNLADNSDIAKLLEVDQGTLTYYVYRLNESSQYKTYQIIKRNGTTRTINAPLSNLKILQEKLNYVLQLVYTPRECAYAFAKGRNVIQNANEHKQSKAILRVDLKNFFDQIHFGRVQGIFTSQYPFGFNIDVARTLANLCTFEGRLPQGAPTSPIISNIICWGLDKDLQDLCRKLRCKYTRYADDITISTKQQELPLDICSEQDGEFIIGKMLEHYLKKHDFIINYEKVKIVKFNKRQLVTGLIVNQIVNVRRQYIHELRLQLRIWEKYGYRALGFRSRNHTHRNPQREIKNYKWTIQGRLNYLKQVVSVNDQVQNYDQIYMKLRNWFDYLVLRDQYNNLKETNNYQKRGYALEDIFNNLFKLNNITATSPFSRRGGADQIDGAFNLSSDFFQVECKWTKTESINKELDAFNSKIQRSGMGAYGLFISIAGWNKHTIQNLKESKTKNIILLDGEDLETILANRKMKLADLLSWKLNSLINLSEPYISAKEFSLAF